VSTRCRARRGRISDIGSRIATSSGLGGAAARSRRSAAGHELERGVTTKGEDTNITLLLSADRSAPLIRTASPGARRGARRRPRPGPPRLGPA
jgi:hypothetical protein